MIPGTACSVMGEMSAYVIHIAWVISMGTGFNIAPRGGGGICWWAWGPWSFRNDSISELQRQLAHSRPWCMTCCAILLQPCFGNFLFSSKVSQEFMAYVNVALRVNCVFEESRPNNPTVRHSTAQHTTLQSWQGGVSWVACEFSSTICKYSESSHNL
jgi:hypothetical protein